MTRVTLVGLPGCHLCDDARVVVESVCAELGASWSEVFIDTDPELFDRYSTLIPVVLVDGEQIATWRVNSQQLRSALTR